MDVDAAADVLYALPPEQFTARRNELAAEARERGDAAARAAISGLRRPTAAAWAVNILVRRHAARVQELFDLASELRSAQRALDGQRLRELSPRRRALVTALAESARAVADEAGRHIGDDVLRAVQATLDAVLSDERAEAAVRAGRLTASLSYSGLGEVEVTDSIGPQAARPRLSAVRAQADSLPASRRVDDAHRLMADRQQEVETARAALVDVTARRDALRAQADSLRSRLNEVEADLRPTDAEMRSAQRRLEVARRAADQAVERMARMTRPT